VKHEPVGDRKSFVAWERDAAKCGMSLNDVVAKRLTAARRQAFASVCLRLG
jgi:hypothetical protein